MVELSLDQVKQVYRCAVDATAKDAEGMDWWRSVAIEVHAVCAAPSVESAAAVIAWWHHDWSTIGDSATAAARRIRQASRMHA